jgi:hypothetical protein
MKDISVQFIIGRARHQQNYSKWLASGMMKHGIKNISIKHQFDPRNKPDLVVFWGHKRPDIIRNQKLYLVMERAYIGERHHWLSLGYNGLNGNANFYNDGITDMTRFNTHFKEYLEPWKENISDKPVLLIGQVPGDASHRHVNIHNWYVSTVSHFKKMKKEVLFRPHPLDKTVLNVPGVKQDTSPSLEIALDTCSCCVTFSSNSGVISALKGIPTIAIDNISMAKEVASRTLDNIEYMPNRNNWCAKMAYTQWLPEELESGIAWNHLKQALIQN